MWVIKFHRSMLMSYLKVTLGRVVIASDSKGVCCKLLVWEKLKHAFQVAFHPFHPTTYLLSCLLVLLFFLSSSLTVSLELFDIPAHVRKAT